MPGQIPSSAGVSTGVIAKLFYHTVWTLLVVSACVFIPARTLDFWQGWAFVAMSVALPIGVGIYFYKRDPQAIARRLQRQEQIGLQKILITLAKILYVCVLILCGFDFRFGWTRAHFGAVPWWISGLALVFIATGDIWFVAVLKANSFASSTIRVEAGQPIAAGGPYRIVRHPMYLGMIVTWLAMPLALGSLVVFPLACLIVPIFALRLLNEEKFLGRELPGYSAYCQQTRWRLIPFVW